LPACPAQQIQINFTFPWVRHAETTAAPSTVVPTAVVPTAADNSLVTSSGATTPCLSDSTGSLNIPEGVSVPWLALLPFLWRSGASVQLR